MYVSSLSRADVRWATAVLAVVVSLTACATPPSAIKPVNANPPGVAAMSVVGPSADRFLGRSVLRLDQMIGSPALIRMEGETEFRRYDLGDCRAYAVIAKGKVTALSTGPSIVGAPARPFEECTAGKGGS